MNKTAVNVYYNYYKSDVNDLVGFEEKNISYEKAKELFDKYPWNDELIALEQRDESGGINYHKGDINDIHTSLNFYIVEDKKVSISLDICAKKGFLGLFGNKKVSRHLDASSFSEAKVILKDIFTYSEDELFKLYK